MPQYLALDFGTKKIGLACHVENIAFPLVVVPAIDIWRKLSEVVSQKSITDFVVGIAYHVNGADSKVNEKIRLFIKQLEAKFPHITVHIHDERFSSAEARFSLEYHEKKPAGRQQIDDISACIILQSYIDSLPR